jgi:hypothetical protein
MSKKPPPFGETLVYRAGDKKTRVDVRFDGKTALSRSLTCAKNA